MSQLPQLCLVETLQVCVGSVDDTSTDQSNENKS